MRIHYLESLDSVRLPWSGEGGVDPGGVGAQHQLQVFAEVLMTLALGRDLVVPQSYAFDSLSFARVAVDLLAARNQVAPGARPIRLHLFRSGSYAGAVAAMVTRTHDPDRPFVSSLYPELRDEDPAELAVLDATTVPRWLLGRDWLGDERGDALELLFAEFAGATPVPARPPREPLTAAAALAALLDPESPARRGLAAGPLARSDALADLLDALRALGADRPEPFGLRSLLRLPLPWPNQPAGGTATAAELAGGPDRLSLVREAMDTLYNLQLIDSIGIAPAALSTEIAAGDRPAEARAIAQQAALAVYESRPREGASHGHGDLLFEVTAAARPDHAAVAPLAPLQERAIEAFAAILRARARDRDFARGIRRIEEAVRAADVPAARRALRDHVRVVSRTLAGIGVESRFDGDKLTVGLVLSGLATSAACDWGVLPGLLGAALGGATQLAPVVVRPWQERRLARSLGAIVDIGTTPGAA
ncbi:MAG: hypothetical protein ACJ73S_22815 [Mycobacteriales bacterium]